MRGCFFGDKADMPPAYLLLGQVLKFTSFVYSFLEVCNLTQRVINTEGVTSSCALYYGKTKLFCTGSLQIQHGVYKPVEWCFGYCDVVHPLHNLIEPIMHIISVKFQSVQPLLYYGKTKLSCTGSLQIQHGVNSLQSGVLVVVMLCTLCTTLQSQLCT